MKKAIYKVPNGKLLKIFLNDAEGSIQSIKITGDFFAHPEENIEKMEESLKNTPLTKEALSNKISVFLDNNPTNLFGVDTDSIVLTILQAT